MAHQEQRARISAQTAKATSRLWADIDPHNLAADWRRKLPRVTALVSAGQLAAAREADPFLSRVLEGVPAEGLVLPDSVAGVSSDGRSLVDLLMYPVWAAISATTRGLTLTAALATGRALLDLLVRTMVADAGRAADLIAMIVRPAVTSYIRVVELPACSRCIVLAGREYGISTEFKRHPRCDCTMEPVTKNYRPEPTSPLAVFNQMSHTEQRRRFGPKALEAIDAGADIAQIVNARRGMGTATRYGKQVAVTTEGTTKRGLAHARLGRTKDRLMPAEIMRIADTREDAIRLLRKYGYIF